MWFYTLGLLFSDFTVDADCEQTEFNTIILQYGNPQSTSGWWASRWSLEVFGLLTAKSTKITITVVFKLK